VRNSLDVNEYLVKVKEYRRENQYLSIEIQPLFSFFFLFQHFSSDMTSEAVKRIEDVRIMRSAQFLQDSGPMAHPIRPEVHLNVYIYIYTY